MAGKILESRIKISNFFVYYYSHDIFGKQESLESNQEQGIKLRFYELHVNEINSGRPFKI